MYGTNPVFDNNTVSGSTTTQGITITGNESRFTNNTLEFGSGLGHGVTGFADPGSYDISSNTFSGFGATGTPTAAIQVEATSGTVTINVADAATATYQSAGATVVIVAGQVTTTITVRDVNTQTPIQGARVYLVANAGGSLAEGTVIINAETDVNGQVSDTRSFASDQPISGYARKASTTPFYQNAPITGTISSTNGLALTSLMIPDE
jgi:hypothetical protein